MSGWTRPRDEHGRAWYAPNEVPPVTERFAHWRGKLTSGYPPSPGSGVSGAHRPPEAGRSRPECIGGWIESGEWWLHCSTCRPGDDKEHDDAD